MIMKFLDYNISANIYNKCISNSIISDELNYCTVIEVSNKKNISRCGINIGDFLHLFDLKTGKHRYFFTKIIRNISNYRLDIHNILLMLLKTHYLITPNIFIREYNDQLILFSESVFGDIKLKNDYTEFTSLESLAYNYNTLDNHSRESKITFFFYTHILCLGDLGKNNIGILKHNNVHYVSIVDSEYKIPAIEYGKINGYNNIYKRNQLKLFDVQGVELCNNNTINTIIINFLNNWDQSIVSFIISSYNLIHQLLVLKSNIKTVTPLESLIKARKNIIYRYFNVIYDLQYLSKENNLNYLASYLKQIENKARLYTINSDTILKKNLSTAFHKILEKYKYSDKDKYTITRVSLFSFYNIFSNLLDKHSTTQLYLENI